MLTSLFVLACIFAAVVITGFVAAIYLNVRLLRSMLKDIEGK